MEAKFNFNGEILKGKWHKNNITRISEEKQAIAIANFCKNKDVRIAGVNKERKEYQPLQLFNLSALQATANKALKFSPQKTLDVLQKLYLKGTVSYPRSDSQYLTNEEAKMLPSILDNLSNIKKYKELLPPPHASIANNKRYVNEKKVTDHHAIIPTEQIPDVSKLTLDEGKIYDLIVRQVIAAHYNNAIFNYTTIHSLVDNRAEFITKGKEQIEDGWRKVIYYSKEDPDEGQNLPSLQEGELGQVSKVDYKKGETQPPKRYTDGKHLDDIELEKVLAKTEGLGTETTRAGIINLLKDRNYIEVSKNQVFATLKGLLLIEALGESILGSPRMTAKWEQRLSEIGEGKASPKAFLEQVKRLSQKLMVDAKEQKVNWSFNHNELDKISSNTQNRSYIKNEKKVIGKCRMCSGTILDFGKFYGCTDYNTSNCKFSISKKILGKTLSQANVKKILKTGETNLIKGFKKDEKAFNAILIWNEKEKKIGFKFNSK